MKNFFNRLQSGMMSDGGLHFVWAFFFSVILGAFLPFWAVLFLGVALGLAKELIDRYVRDTYFSLADLLFSILGTLAAVLLTFLTK